MVDMVEVRDAAMDSVLDVEAHSPIVNLSRAHRKLAFVEGRAVEELDYGG